MKILPRLLCAFSLLAMTAPALADNGFPDRAVYWLVPWAPGGASDTVGRIIGDKLTKALGQSVVVENRPGAGGNIGTEMAARAAPDGYTLVQLTDATTISPSLYPALKYDPVQAFSPISLIATGPHVLVVNSASSIRTLADLISQAKTKPDALNYATAGIGSAQHLAVEMFKRVAHLKMVHVPYKGGGPALIDVLGGQVPVGVFGLAPVLPHIRAGKLRAIAVTSIERLPTLPDIPTIAESGFPGFSSVQWFGVAAPAGTPAPIVSKLNREVVGVLQNPEVKRSLEKLGATVVADTPEQFARYIQQDADSWSSIVKNSGIKLE